MPDDLFLEVSQRLAARKGQWMAIAKALAPDISYSMISKIGRGAYQSSPSYQRLRTIVDHLRGIEAHDVVRASAKTEEECNT